MTTKDGQRTTVFLNPKILKHAKAQAVLEDVTLTILIERALVNYLPEETVIKKVNIN